MLPDILSLEHIMVDRYSCNCNVIQSILVNNCCLAIFEKEKNQSEQDK
nr:MAG TPA: hypothetical protein [Caudoviricetes sp.]